MTPLFAATQLSQSPQTDTHTGSMGTGPLMIRSTIQQPLAFTPTQGKVEGKKNEKKAGKKNRTLKLLYIYKQIC